MQREEERPGAPCCLHAVPHEVLLLVLSKLPSVDLQSSACTCRCLRSLCSTVAPGLAVVLYPHQRAALAWMLEREQPCVKFLSPLVRTGDAVTQDGVAMPFLLNMAGLQLCPCWDEGQRWRQVTPVDCRGGMLCDEPGMGKTVTVLALLLRTRGRAAESPDSKPGSTIYMRNAGGAGTSRTSVVNMRAAHLACATLVVVPGTLIDHWVEQAARHVAPGTAPLRVLLESQVNDPVELARCDMVLTTFERLSVAKSDSPLFAIHWLRVVLDEGHALGSNAITDRHKNACALLAERRWLMTGTPAPEQAGASFAEQASRLKPLLAFLRDPTYGSSADWKAAIGRLLNPGHPSHGEGVARLRACLSRVMARAVKADMPNLARCRHKVTLLNFEAAHAKSYNELCLFTERALLLADWNDPECPQSLLHPRQAAQCRNTVRNLRLACSVAGTWARQWARVEIDDSRGMQCDVHHPGWKGILPAAHQQPGWRPPSEARLDAAEKAWMSGGTCELCGLALSLVVVTPCSHVLCMDCVQTSAERCALPSCRMPFAMQVTASGARVPQDCIELQPAIIHSWSSSWEKTNSSKVDHVLRGLKAVDEPELWAAGRARAVRRRHAVAHAVHATRAAAHADLAGDQQLTLGQTAKLIDALSKAALAALVGVESEDRWTSDGSDAHKTPPKKHILYSPFLDHLQLFATHLLDAGIRFAWLVAGCSAEERRAFVGAFKHDPTTTVLLMDEAGEVGHDLSCASNVWLLEPLRDAAREEQVISRAHRLGCLHATVEVETLAMRGTMEESLLHLRRTGSSSAAEALQNRELLRSLAFVRTEEGGEEAATAAPTLDETQRFLSDVFIIPKQAAKLLGRCERLAAKTVATPKCSGGVEAAAFASTPEQLQAPRPRIRLFE